MQQNYRENKYFFHKYILFNIIAKLIITNQGKVLYYYSMAGSTVEVDIGFLEGQRKGLH
jgi:hypothetical protein